MTDNNEAIEAVSVSESAPVTAQKKAKSQRQAKPKRTFPQFTIEESRKIADALKQFNAGNPWAPKDIAAALKMGRSNNFFYLTASSRDYDLTIGTRDTEKIELSSLGRKLVYPKSQQEEAEAIQSAFRSVELFKNVFDYYQGENLPEIQYLKNTLKTEFGVSEEYQDDFYDIYQSNLSYLKSKGELPTALPNVAAAKAGASSIILGESNNAGTLVAFVAMPFSEKTSAYPKGYFDEVLKHLITPAAVKANFNARTAKKAGSEVI